MGSRYMDYPSPRGAHVAQTYREDNDDDDDDPYRRDPVLSPRRNRYSRSVHQTPRLRDVTWISSPDAQAGPQPSPVGPTPQTPQAPTSPWRPPGSMPTPARPPSTIPPSPAPTVGEHMTVDDIVGMPEAEIVDAYRPQRQGSLIKSFWRGLKKLGRSHSEGMPMPGHAHHGLLPQTMLMSMSMPVPMTPRMSSLSGRRTGSSESQMVEVPAPSMPSDGTQSQSPYVNPTPLETAEQPGGSPYASLYVRPGGTPAGIPPRALRASPGPAMSMSMSMPMVPPVSPPMPASRSAPMRARSPVVDHVPPITVTIVSPSIPPSPLPQSIRSARLPTPGPGAQRTRSRSRTRSYSESARMPEPILRTPPPAEDGSQTLHEPVFAEPARLPMVSDGPPVPMPMPITDPNGKFGLGGTSVAFDMSRAGPSSGSGSGLRSRPSTMSRVRRFVAGLEDLPWVSDDHIADAYVPEANPRSRMRRKMRQGTEPSWYNPRPEVEERPEYWAQWDMWAKQSTAGLWGVADQVDGWSGAMPVYYPQGYVPAPYGPVAPSGYPPPGVDDANHAPVIP